MMTVTNGQRAMLWLAVMAVSLPTLVGFAPVDQEATSRASPPGWALEGSAEDGRTIYKVYCQKCHGKRGDGKGTMAADLDPKPRDFTDTEIMGNRTDWQIFLGIKEGGAPVGLSDQMTAWEDTLTEQEMQDVALFIRQFAGTNEQGEGQ